MVLKDYFSLFTSVIKEIAPRKAKIPKSYNFGRRKPHLEMQKQRGHNLQKH